jgi:hypothetical protein
MLANTTQVTTLLEISKMWQCFIQFAQKRALGLTYVHEMWIETHKTGSFTRVFGSTAVHYYNIRHGQDVWLHV